MTFAESDKDHNERLKVQKAYHSSRILSSAITFMHISTTPTTGGVCSAGFEFDSGFQEIKDLKVYVSVVNKSGDEVTTGVLKVDHFGTCSATRYVISHLETEEMCNDNLTIIVNKATAIIGGKHVNLLQNKELTVGKFNPYKIIIEPK